MIDVSKYPFSRISTISKIGIPFSFSMFLLSFFFPAPLSYFMEIIWIVIFLVLMIPNLIAQYKISKLKGAAYEYDIVLREMYHNLCRLSNFSDEQIEDVEAFRWYLPHGIDRGGRQITEIDRHLYFTMQYQKELAKQGYSLIDRFKFLSLLIHYDVWRAWETFLDDPAMKLLPFAWQFILMNYCMLKPQVDQSEIFSRCMIANLPTADAIAPLVVQMMMRVNGLDSVEKEIIGDDIYYISRGTYFDKEVVLITTAQSICRRFDRILEEELNDNSLLISLDAHRARGREKMGLIKKTCTFMMGGYGYENTRVEEVTTEKKADSIGFGITIQLGDIGYPIPSYFENVIPEVVGSVLREIETTKRQKVVIVGVGNSVGVDCLHENNPMEMLEEPFPKMKVYMRIGCEKCGAITYRIKKKTYPVLAQIDCPKCKGKAFVDLIYSRKKKVFPVPKNYKKKEVTE